eukprot:IDg12352t1
MYWGRIFDNRAGFCSRSRFWSYTSGNDWLFARAGESYNPSCMFQAPIAWEETDVCRNRMKARLDGKFVALSVCGRIVRCVLASYPFALAAAKAAQQEYVTAIWRHLATGAQWRGSRARYLEEVLVLVG